MSEKVLVLDAFGVIYAFGDDVADALIPFARENGAVLTDSEIIRCYRECSLGKISDAELWRRIGLVDPCDVLNERYLSRHKLNAEFPSFAEAMGRRGVRMACISNDVSAWSQRLRRRLQIEHLFFDWTISGDVKIRKPDPGIYAHFLAANCLRAEDCVFVDDRVQNLDSARQLGFTTVLFAPEVSCAVTDAHPIASSLHELESWLATPAAARLEPSGRK